LLLSSSSRIACYELGSIHELLTPGTGAGRVRRARAQRASCERQRQALGFQRFSDVLQETLPQQRRKRLGPRIDAQTLLSKRDASAFTQKTPWRELVEHRFADDEIQTGVAAGDGMAHPVAFVRVEEENLIRLGNGIVSAEMPNEDTAIWERHVGGVRGFLVALVPAAPRAVDIPDCDERSLQQRSSGNVRHRSTTIMD